MDELRWDDIPAAAEHDEDFIAFLDEVLLSGNSDPDDGAVCDGPVSTPPGGSDPADLKRQSRLLRNRLSASQSRQRKKSYLKDLESKSKMLESRCYQLQQAVNFVSAENTVLRAEVSRLRHNKVKSSGAEPAVLVKGSLPLEFLSRPCCLIDLLETMFMVIMFFLVCFPPRNQVLLLLHHEHKEETKGREVVDAHRGHDRGHHDSSTCSRAWWPPWDVYLPYKE